MRRNPGLNAKLCFSHRDAQPNATGAPQMPASSKKQPAQYSDSSIGRLRIAKRYAPTQNGAKRFLRRYGDQLVCVRHRLSDDGKVRHTTIELLVESTPIVSRMRSIIALRIPQADKGSRQLLMACNAKWKPKERVWLVSQLIAKNLKLLRYRVPMPG